MSNLNFYPPTIYFNDINFNNDFYAIPNNDQGISLAYANTHFLFSTGVANSTATSTFFSGSVGVGAIATGLAGDMNALKYLLNGNNISNIFVIIVLSDTSNILNSSINSKEDKLTVNTQFSRVENTISLIGTNMTGLNATNFSSGTLSTARGGTQWAFFRTSNINYAPANNGNVMINSFLCNYEISNLIPNSTAKRYIMSKHKTFNGNIGVNFPKPECALLMTNSRSDHVLP